MSVRPIPEGFHTVTPYLTVKDAPRAIEFYKRAFGARERRRMLAPDGKTVGHAEIVVGNSIVMLADEIKDCGNRSPLSFHGTPVSFAIYVEDADAVFKRAVEAGATVKQPMDNKFYGDRAGTLEDPFGHQWTVMTHVEDVPPAEMERRMKEFFAEMASHRRPEPVPVGA
jgi:PhnB protein